MTERVALVTGTSRGLGEAIAAQLAARGLRVVATSRDAQAGKQSAAALGLEFLRLDVSEAGDIAAVAEWVSRQYGGLDVLVNNAGISLFGFDARRSRRTLDVNFVGTLRLTDALLPLLRPQARVVMVSSGMGELSCLGRERRREFSDPALSRQDLLALADRFVADVEAGTHRRQGWPQNAYSVSKVAMNAYVRLLARELATDPRGIEVNAACPGWVRTAMGGPDATRSAEEGAQTPVWLATRPPGSPSGLFFRSLRPIPW
jgi:carbonyl reductase 1